MRDRDDQLGGVAPLAHVAVHAQPHRELLTRDPAGSVEEAPVIRYLQSARMQRARTLLRSERATVSAVAARVGYSSGVAFAAAFRRDVGVSPGGWRRATMSVDA